MEEGFPRRLAAGDLLVARELCPVDEGCGGQQKPSRHTGPTKSGTNKASSPTLPRMKKKPIRVTMFGASHTGRSSAAQFHCSPKT